MVGDQWVGGGGDDDGASKFNTSAIHQSKRHEGEHVQRPTADSRSHNPRSSARGASLPLHAIPQLYIRARTRPGVPWSNLLFMIEVQRHELAY